MQILFLTQILPYPPDAGPRVKTWNVLRYLVCRGHEIHLASFIRPEEQAHLGAVFDLCASVSTVPILRSRPVDLLAWLRSYVSGRPFLVERDDVRDMRELVQRIMASKGVEAIHADQLTMAQFALEANGLSGANGHNPQLTFDAHNAVWTIVERMKQQLPALLGPVIDLESRRTKAYEGQIVRAFDRTLAVSEPDRAALIQASASGSNGNGTLNIDGFIASRISVVPIGVDTKQLNPIPRPDHSKSILTLGTLHYPPNADGVRWFAREVLPLIRDQVPDSALTIIGANPPRDLHRLARNSDGAIDVMGYVPDLTPHLETAAVMVVPVRVGGGMRVRILEGFARGIPMVATSLGLEGIEAKSERHILVADTPAEFAGAVVRLLQDRQLQEEMTASARLLVERKYDWRRVLAPLDEIYCPAVNRADAAS